MTPGMKSGDQFMILNYRKMKKITILVFVILTNLSGYSQKWEHIIGLPGRHDFSMNIIEHYDGGYLISGNINYGGEDTHGWLIKTDINGEILWDKVITQLPDKALITKTLFDPVGNIYVLGWLHQDQPHEFPFIIKLDACGELQWCRLLAIDGYDYGFFNDALFLNNGDLLGLAIMPEDDPSNNNRIILFRISPVGDLIWKKGFATHENHPYYGNPFGRSIYHFGDIYLISGNVYSPYPNSPNPYHVYQRPMFIGINEDFEEEWIVEFGIQDSLLGIAETVVPISDTLFMGVGRYRYFNEFGQYDESGWLMFFNCQGEQVAYKILEDNQFGSEVLGSFLFGVDKIEVDKYLLATGYMYDEEDNFGSGEIVVDTSGNVFTYAIREGTMGAGIYVSKSFDKKFILNTTCQQSNQSTYDFIHYKINDSLDLDTIYPGNYTYDTLCKHQIQSGLIDLSGCGVITAIDEIPTLEEYRQHLQSIGITASPNPSATGEILLEMENTTRHPNLQIKVFDVFGKVIHTQAILPAQGALRLDTSGWNAGIYVAAVFSSGQIRGKCKLLIE